MTTTTRSADEQLLDSAEKLMLAKGYTAAGVEEICRDAGLSKGSFYHHFGSKQELGLAVLERFNDRARRRLMQGPYRETDDPVQRALDFVDHAEDVARELWGDGCLLGNFATELAERKPEIRRRVSEVWTRSVEGIAEVLAPVAEADDGAPPPGPATASQLAEHFLVVLEGAIVMARAHDDWSRVPRALAEFRRYLRCVAG